MCRSFLIAILVGGFCFSCPAQEISKQPIYDSTNVFKPADPWESSTWVFAVTPYGWFPEISGKATLGRFTGSADTSFSTILDNLDFAGMGRIEAFNGDWSLFVDSVFCKVSANFDLSVPPLSATLDMDETLSMTDIGASYKIFDETLAEGRQRIFVTPYAGGRYVYIKQELDISPTGPFAPIVGSGTLGGSADYVEPFFGGRVIWQITDRFFTAIRGDVGGFGIGSASDLTWNLLGWIGYHITKNTSIEGGYRILDIDYSHGSGRDAFGLNAQLRGPVAGLTIRF